MDFIDKIINIYTELFTKYRNVSYTADGKDRKAVGLLLKKHRNKNKVNTEQTLADFRTLFTKCLQITSSDWLRENMTLPVINSKINEIKLVIKNEEQDRRMIERDEEVKEDLRSLEPLITPKQAKEMFAMPEREFNKQPVIKLTKTQFLKQFGAGRLNEYEQYLRGLK